MGKLSLWQVLLAKIYHMNTDDFFILLVGVGAFVLLLVLMIGGFITGWA